MNQYNLVYRMIRWGKKNFYLSAGVFGCIVYALSFLGYYTKMFGSAMLVIGTILTAIIGWFSLPMGIAIALAELIFGSQGGSLFVVSDPFRLTLRMTIWTVLIGIALIRGWQQRKQVISAILASSLRYGFVALCIVIMWGWTLGIIYHNDLRFLITDGNGYLYYAFLMPVLVAMMDTTYSQEKIARLVVWMFTAMAIFQILFFLFSSWTLSMDWYAIVYYWVRDFRIVEIGKLAGSSLVRMFVQSQLYAVIALGMLLPQWYKTKISRNDWLISVLVVSVIFMSLSRSLWIGAMVMIFVFSISCKIWKSWKQAGRFAMRAVIVSLVSIAILSLSTASGFIGVVSGIQERSSFTIDEPAMRSRWELWPKMIDAIAQKPWFGYGFGKTITYASSDPKLVKIGVAQQYITSSFEWGYLDLLVKIGIIGTLFFIFFLFQVWRLGWRFASDSRRNTEISMVYFGLWLGYTSLLVINFFTPYLNHPLGIGFIVVYTVLLLEKEHCLGYKTIPTHSE